MDLFVHEARLAGQPIGPIAVVKTTADVERSGRIPAIRRAEGFPVHIRGYREGVLVDERITVRSVDLAYDVGVDWPKVVDLFATEVEIAVSNVGDRGYEISSQDRVFDVTAGRVPASFPAKLLVLLMARHEAGGRPLLFLPAELVAANGHVLSRIITELAGQWNTTEAFRDWLVSSVVFADCLVDRIVSAAIDPVGAVAEPYALWAIRRGNFEPPLTHRAVVITDDLEPFERLKLHILNLGHTLLAEEWIRSGSKSTETVSRMLSDTTTSERLADIYACEVVPGFGVHGMAEVAARYVETTLDRLRNPFLEHRIADIANNHTAKVGRRIGAFVDWVHATDPQMRLPRLIAVASAYT